MFLHTSLPSHFELQKWIHDGKSDITLSSKNFQEKKSILAIPQSTAFPHKLNAMRFLL